MNAYGINNHHMTVAAMAWRTVISIIMVSIILISEDQGLPTFPCRPTSQPVPDRQDLYHNSYYVDSMYDEYGSVADGSPPTHSLTQHSLTHLLHTLFGPGGGRVFSSLTPGKRALVDPLD